MLAWTPVTISIAGPNAPSGQQVFFFNETGFQFDQSYSESTETSAGWLGKSLRGTSATPWPENAG